MKIDQFIYDYMNTISTTNREYTLEEVRKLKRCVSLEKEDRINAELKINPNSVTGRKEINVRTHTIAKTVFKLDVTVKDIVLFRKCKSKEAKDRKLVNNFKEDTNTPLPTKHKSQRKPRESKYSKDFVNHILELKREGLCNRQIGILIGLKRSQVYGIIDRNRKEVKS